MLLVPSATRVACTDTGADDLLRRLAALLPDAWIVAGGVGAKPVSDTCSRGHTRPFDAIIIGDRMIFVLDIWSHAGPSANRQKSGIFARFHDESLPDDFWKSFRREIEKLKSLLHDRFEVEPGRVTPEKIWIREAAAAADIADLRRFARAATRLDKAAMFAPLQRRAIDRIATFLTDDAPTAPKPTELFFTDGATPTVVARTPAAPATPAPIAPSRQASPPAAPAVDPVLPVVARAAGAAAAVPGRPSYATQDELLLQHEAPIAPPAAPAPIAAPRGAVRKASPTLDAAMPEVAEAAGAAAAPPVRPSHPATAEVSLLSSPTAPVPVARPEKAPAPAPTGKDAAAPLVPDAARSAAPSTADGDASPDRALPAAPASSAPPGEASPPVPATKAAAAPLIAKAAEAPAAHYAIDADAPLGQAEPSVAFAPAQWRLAAHWKWLAALLLLLLVSQAATIGWLALFDRASPHPEPAPQAAPAPAAPAPDAKTAEPFVVRSLAAFEPMRVGDQTATLRAGPSPDFPAVAWLDGGTQVVARGRADGPGGSSWIEITAADGAVGFVPDNMVQPEPAAAPAIETAEPPTPTPTPNVESASIERAAAPKLAPAPKIKRATAPKKALAPKIRYAAAPKQTPIPKIKRAARPAQASREPAAPPPSGITCILPGGEEIQATRSDCRAQSGIIYQ